MLLLAYLNDDKLGKLEPDLEPEPEPEMIQLPELQWVVEEERYELDYRNE